MEWWILSGLAVAVLAVGALTRLRRSRRRQAHKLAQNIYPLW
ncbi:MAG TPA: hypothetical protein VHT52_25125 [Stellaceae bacterium]|jgi:hypothetical protein|nr:hypothetical protein [Stellaceae bacterium]